MSVVTFYGNGKIETSQTASMAAISTYLSVEKEYKILLINTKYNDTSLKDCFWEQSKGMQPIGDFESGISGLIKALASNKTSPEIITNYTKTIFKNRLEILTDDTIISENYEKQKEYMKNIIRMANNYYDLVFVDAEGNLGDLYIQNILQESNLVIANTSQRIKYIEEFVKNYEQKDKNNVLYLIGKYDKFSKYNAKNIERTKRIYDVYGIPYNTLLFEACNDGGMADFIINYRNVKPNSVQAPVMNAIAEVGERIIEKLKEIQMQI